MNLKTLLWLSPGTQVSHHKETANLPTEQLPVPEKVILPMRQHVGAACEACVQKGDRVLVGTMVGRAPSAMSMHIYSSVSGTVSSVEQILYNAGENDTVVVISPDGTQTPDPDIRPPEVHDLDSFVGALEHSGIVSLGGAGFPHRREGAAQEPLGDRHPAHQRSRARAVSDHGQPGVSGVQRHSALRDSCLS